MDRQETAQNQEPTSTTQSKPQISPKKPILSVKKMVGPTKKTRTRLSRKQRLVLPIVVVQEHGDEEDEKAEVEQKIAALQRIVPGGEDLAGVDKLFEETAGYIKALQNQVMAMRALTSFFEGLEKEKTMLGG